jgi:hypothetical protein
MVEERAMFRKPNYFDERLGEVKRKISKLNVKTQSSTNTPISIGGGLPQG